MLSRLSKTLCASARPIAEQTGLTCTGPSTLGGLLAQPMPTTNAASTAAQVAELLRIFVHFHDVDVTRRRKAHRLDFGYGSTTIVYSSSAV